MEMLQIQSLEEAVGTDCGQVLCQGIENHCSLFENDMEMEKAETILRRKDGSCLSVIKTFHKMLVAGELTFLETFIDVSKWKQLEIELGHARKLEAVGQLAAGIAHEINTPTQFVGDSISFLKDTFQDLNKLLPLYEDSFISLKESGSNQELACAISEKEEEIDLSFLRENIPGAFDRCLDGISRISKIVSAMKEFAHPDQRDKNPADINRALDSTLTIARNEYKYVAEIETDFGEIPAVVCHISDLNQVF